jgi:hypothetical protein
VTAHPQTVLTLYGNLGGHSGVIAYQTGEDFLKVLFRNQPRLYVYDFAEPGPAHVNRMQRLAATGLGLSGYISKHVRNSYSRIESLDHEIVGSLFGKLINQAN